MSTDNTRHDTPAVPRHVVIGIGCIFLAATLTVLALVYYVLIGTGVITDPMLMALSGLWAVAIAVAAMVPIGLWCTGVAGGAIHARLDQIEEKLQSALDQVSSEALEAVRQAGRWEGVAQSLDGGAFPRTTADVVRIFDRERDRSAR